MNTDTFETKTTAIEPDNVDGGLRIGDIDWKTYLPLAVAIALLFWTLSPIFKGWWSNWTQKDSYYSHGPLVPLVSLFIIWLKKQEIVKIPIKATPIGYLILIPATILLTLLLVAGSGYAAGLLLPLIIAGMVLVILGWRMLREVAFPVAFLWFMTVLPGFILIKTSFKIQLLSTQIATLLLKATGIGAYCTGVMINLPNGTEVMVGAPCSGFRLLISLLAITVLFAYIVEGPLWGRLAIVAFTGPVSLIVNSLRIMMIAMVGEYMGETTMHKFHDWSGYIVIVIAFIILWFFSRLVKCQKFNSKLML